MDERVTLMGDQVTFKDVFKDNLYKNSYEYLKNENMELMYQILDANRALREIELALDLGQDNDWARHSIERYRKKYRK